VGIAPDIEVGPSIEDPRNGKDVVLEKALALLVNTKTGSQEAETYLGQFSRQKPTPLPPAPPAPPA
jgi:hypothetical protein